MTIKYEIGDTYSQALNDIATVIHQCNVDRGWWDDLYAVLDVIKSDPTLRTEESLLMCRKVETWFDLAKAALIHSEVSEMVEGIRKGTKDSHLTWRDADEVEGADVFIRLADLMSKRGCDLGGATDEKFTYNQERADHKKENREGKGGKLV